ncbi:hypothetical protein OIE13_22400 [Streptosporangium sp. NBC_01810]|uniref:hypothetical protein n=1 Tax=Streptosporangium sp. NBC_01810 TaxID=2975951 RepID=UPI002DDB87C1|nr:hypothetical protein [Streptosporangium sp. NBC_01810]WSA23695.1 hypothetical protein OIE13_22400 [Streptosporangium sp. NBC_01810]
MNVPLSQGADTSRTWQVTSGDEPANLTSATVTAVIKTNTHVDDDDVAAHTFAEGDGLTIVDAAQGHVRIRIPTAVTQHPGAWYYKIVVEAGEDTEPAIHGWITIMDT